MFIFKMVVVVRGHDELAAKLADNIFCFVIVRSLFLLLLKGCHPIQNLGAVQTYIRRYLWVTAMEIVEHDALDSSAPIKEAVIITPAQGIRDELPIEILKYLDELAVELIATCEKDPKAAWVRLEQENLEADQKVALWGLMPSNIRSAIKKAKG